jgi:hypothetical protein
MSAQVGVVLVSMSLVLLTGIAYWYTVTVSKDVQRLDAQLAQHQRLSLQLAKQYEGPLGPRGTPGTDGVPGLQGSPGAKGLDGAPGPVGQPGLDAMKGLRGEPGVVGPPGVGVPGNAGKEPSSGGAGLIPLWIILGLVAVGGVGFWWINRAHYEFSELTETAESFDPDELAKKIDR